MIWWHCFLSSYEAPFEFDRQISHHILNHRSTYGPYDMDHMIWNISYGSRTSSWVICGSPHVDTIPKANIALRVIQNSTNARKMIWKPVHKRFFSKFRSLRIKSNFWCWPIHTVVAVFIPNGDPRFLASTIDKTFLKIWFKVWVIP